MAGEEAHRGQGCCPPECPVWVALKRAERSFDLAQGALSNHLNGLTQAMDAQGQRDGDRLVRLELTCKAELQDGDGGCCPPSCGIPPRVQNAVHQLGLQGRALDDLQRYVEGMGEALSVNLENSDSLGQHLEGLKAHVRQMGSEAGPYLLNSEKGLGGKMWGMYT